MRSEFTQETPAAYQVLATDHRVRYGHVLQLQVICQGSHPTSEIPYPGCHYRAGEQAMLCQPLRTDLHTTIWDVSLSDFLLVEDPLAIRFSHKSSLDNLIS